ncbi:hypothetical protein AVEN_63607-1 [Araneus ventricosus]|uniref:CCHC-type domain-containing protein n=1 Tax=Araneus ventricosus TaxID=182803 RepID=A0A4Y2SN42_ARAVE|nr:hypothetical protein AVEN_63607-1 [Araneus ventricosus]
MRSSCRSVSFLLLMDSKLPPRVGRAWRPIRRVVHLGPWCINRPVSQSLDWSAQGDQAKGLYLQILNKIDKKQNRKEKTKSTRKLRSGDLLIEVATRKQAQQIVQLKSLDTIPVNVTAHATLNSSKGVISCGELLNVPVEEICKGFQSQGITHVHRIKIKRDGHLIDTKHLILTFHSPKIPESVRAGYIKLTVRPYIPNPLRCFKCQRIGHTKASCRGTLTCARCAEASHDSSDCKACEKCVNCKGSHTSFSRLCSAWKFEKEVIAEKVKQDISFLEARQIVKSRTPTPGTSYASIMRKKPETTGTRILPTIVPSVPFKAFYKPFEICPRSIDSVLKLSLTDTCNETVSFQFKVPESHKNPPDFSDFKTVTNRKKLKKDSQVNQDNITVDKVSQYYKPPQLTDKKPSDVSNSVIKESNITVTKNVTKSVCFVGPVPDSMAAFPPVKAKVLQSLESDADAEMSYSSASEGDTLEYDMSEDLEDTPQDVCPTTPPPPSTARKR